MCCHQASLVCHATLHFACLNMTLCPFHCICIALHNGIALLHCVTLHYVALHCITALHYITLYYITLHYIASHYITLHCHALHYITLHCIALHYITLHCHALHYIALHCNTSHYITLHYIALHCITLYYITLHYIHYIALHFITLHYITLHRIALHYITLHYIALHLSRKLAELCVDLERPGDFNQALMELGATVCTPRNPRCKDCPISASCLAYRKVRKGGALSYSLRQLGSERRKRVYTDLKVSGRQKQICTHL